jgi:alkylhydroperoxidase family enzyme
MGEINLLCAMANNPDILQSYMRYGTTIWSDSGLADEDVERCILTVARRLEAAYEWNQHVPIARDLGVPAGEIDAIAAQEFERFGNRRQAILEFAAAAAEGDVDDEQFEALTNHVDDATIVGITQLVTHYIATARFLDVLAIPLEGEFVGWQDRSQ